MCRKDGRANGMACAGNDVCWRELETDVPPATKRTGTRSSPKNPSGKVAGPNGPKLSYDHWRGQAWIANDGRPPVGVSCSALLGAGRGSGTLPRVLGTDGWKLLAGHKGAGRWTGSKSLPERTPEREVGIVGGDTVHARPVGLAIVAAGAHDQRAIRLEGRHSGIKEGGCLFWHGSKHLTNSSSATEAGEEGHDKQKRADRQPLFAGARC